MNQISLPTLDATQYALAIGIFLKALGVVYLLAFLSLIGQVRGLYGLEGLAPIRAYMQQSTQYNIFRVSTHDFFLVLTCLLGLAASASLVAGFYPSICLFTLLIIYWSYVKVGQNFLSFQWDALLLETSFIAFFISLASPPSVFLLLALWILLFRVMFSSGIVKLISGDNSWRDLSALKYHYETQPLPNRIAWYMHQLPAFFHRVSCALLFAVELIIPFFIFGPNELKLVAFVAIVTLQIVLILTGNFSFLNYLLIALCLPLLSNAHLNNLETFKLVQTQVSIPFEMSYFLEGAGVLFCVLNVFQLMRLFQKGKWIATFMHAISPSWITRPYGLFAVMTKKRPELIIQGSNDGVNWKPYEFRYKVQNLYHPPKQVAPFHPRLDWQMWFAALHTEFPLELWLYRLLLSVLNGSKPALALLKSNPFPKNPPKYARIDVYHYHFCDYQTHLETGQWWERKLMAIGEPLEIRNDRIKSE